MAATNLSTTLKNAIVAAYGTAIGTSGKVKLMTAADAVLVTIGLNASGALDTAADGAAEFLDPTTGGGDWSAFSQLPASAGVISYVSVQTSADAEVFRQTVSTIAAGTGDWQFTTLTLDTAVPCTMTAAPTLTQP